MKAKKTEVKKTVKPAQEKHPEGWFLMAREEFSVQEIREALPERADIEIWKEAGVLEIPVDPRHSVDIEEMDFPEDEESRSFFQERGIVKIFYISFQNDIWDAASGIMGRLVKTLNAEIWADTEDYQPRILAPLAPSGGTSCRQLSQ